jgi:hypothetical protein
VEVQQEFLAASPTLRCITGRHSGVSAIIFLMLYFCAPTAMLLFGAEIDTVLEGRRHQIARSLQ